MGMKTAPWGGGGKQRSEATAGGGSGTATGREAM